MIALADDHPAAVTMHAVVAELRRLPDLGGIPDLPIRYSPTRHPQGAVATAAADITFYPGRDDARPALERMGRILATGRRPGVWMPRLPWALQVAAHEAFHGLPGGRSHDPAERSLDEGFATAVAIDLVAPLAWRLWRVQVPAWAITYPAAYRGCLALVRRASGRATGGAWTSLAARSWRRRWVAADGPARAAEMVRLGLPAGCSIP